MNHAASFNHLIGAGEQRGRHVEADRLGGREIDEELEIGRLDDREVSRFFALEEAGPMRLTSVAIAAPEG